MRHLALAFLVALAPLALASDLDLPVDRPGPKQVSEKPVTVEEPTYQEDEKAPTVYGSELPKAGSVWFVIDVSGSMGLDLDSEWLDRLGRAKRELTRAVQSLPTSWSFDVSSYDCDPYYFRSNLVPADQDNVKAAVEWINALKPQGATGTGFAVGSALKIAPTNMLIVLLTDGDPNCNSMTMNGNVPAEVHRADIKAANVRKATIDVFGISATGQFAQFCRDVASDNNGVFVQVR